MSAANYQAAYRASHRTEKTVTDAVYRARRRGGLPAFEPLQTAQAKAGRRCRDRKLGRLPSWAPIGLDLFTHAVALGECLEWQCSRTAYGYGKVWFDVRLQGAHRLALEIKLGRPLIPGMFACHTCDNPPCIRPEHLFEGTSADNARDSLAKGRGRNQWSAGNEAAG